MVIGGEKSNAYDAVDLSDKASPSNMPAHVTICDARNYLQIF